MNKRFRAGALLPVMMTVAVWSAPAVARSEQQIASVTARLTLPSKKLVAGSVVQAKLRVVNRTGNPVTVTTCGSPFAVALSNKAYKPLIGWFDCAMSFTIPEGTSAYDLPLRASYSSCGGEGTIPGQGRPVPCDPGPPPLPTGTYQVRLSQNPTVAIGPDPIRVRVVSGDAVSSTTSA